MKTTLDLDDELLVRAKALAAREGRSLTGLIEDGLRLRLRSRRQGAGKVAYYLSTHLKAEGARIIVTDIDTEKARRVVEEMGATMVAPVDLNLRHHISFRHTAPC